MSYTIGNVVRITVQFRDESGTLVDPTDVEFRVVSPSRTRTAIAGTKKAVGIYYADVTASAHGKWAYRAIATGAVVAATEGAFEVALPIAGFDS